MCAPITTVASETRCTPHRYLPLLHRRFGAFRIGRQGEGILGVAMGWQTNMAVWALGLCLGGGVQAAEILTYDTPGEKAGAGMVAPPGHREQVRSLTAYCGTAFPTLKGAAQEAFVRWVGRHAGFLRASQSLREQALKAPDPEKAAQFRQLIDDDMPKAIQSMARNALQPLENLPQPEARQTMCRQIIAAIDDRRFDLDARDPAIAAYLREITGRQPGESAAAPAPETLPALSPAARQDAAALPGRWQAVRTIIHLFNGTAQTRTTPCTIDFSVARFISECPGKDGPLRIVYAYHLLAPGRFESEIVEHRAMPNLRGRRSETAFQVDGDKLVLTAYPPVSATTPETAPVKIESLSRRESAPR